MSILPFNFIGYSAKDWFTTSTWSWIDNTHIYRCISLHDRIDSHCNCLCRIQVSDRYLPWMLTTILPLECNHYIAGNLHWLQIFLRTDQLPRKWKIRKFSCMLLFAGDDSNYSWMTFFFPECLLLSPVNNIQPLNFTTKEDYVSWLGL